jgi:hypothetical protein
MPEAGWLFACWASSQLAATIVVAARHSKMPVSCQQVLLSLLLLLVVV